MIIWGLVISNFVMILYELKIFESFMMSILGLSNG